MNQTANLEVFSPLPSSRLDFFNLDEKIMILLRSLNGIVHSLAKYVTNQMKMVNVAEPIACCCLPWFPSSFLIDLLFFFPLR